MMIRRIARHSRAVVLSVVALMSIAPKPARAGLCTGDCGLDGQVTVDELVFSVGLALNGGNVRPCRSVDTNGDRQVTVDELVNAVSYALNGCPATVDVYQSPVTNEPSGPLSTSSAVLPNGRRIEAAGTQISVETFPLNVALTPDEKHLIVTNDGYGNEDFDRVLQVIDTANGSVTRTSVRHHLSLALGPNGDQVFVCDGQNNTVQRLRLVDGVLQSPETIATLPDGTYPTGVTVSADAQYLFVIGLLSNTFWTIEVDSGMVHGLPNVGNFPYSILLAADGQRAFVTSWGLNNGNPTGLIPAPLPPLDPNLPQMSSVTVVDLATATQPKFRRNVAIARSMKVDNKKVFGGSHPSAMALSPDGALLYVTATNLDLLVVIDTATYATVAEVALNPVNSGPNSSALQGLYPEAIAVSADGHRIYVADAGINAVQAIDADPQARTFASAGFIPTGWYPAALALTRDGKRLYVANAKGVGVAGNGGQLIDISDTDLGGTPYYIGRIIKGSISVIDDVDHYDLNAGTAAIRRLNGFDPVVIDSELVQGQAVPPDFGASPSPLIKHVVYILKENRTYDQVFGEFPGGNGDPRLTLFGDDVAPNHHQLAHQFAMGDNFYDDGEVSIPGHEWTDQGNNNDWIEKLWPFDYNHGGIAETLVQVGQEGFTKGGYLFELLDREQVPFRVYGEAFALLSRLEAGINGGGVQSIFPKLVEAAGSVSNLAAHTSEIIAGNLPALEAAGINTEILTHEVWPNLRLDYPSNILPDKTDVGRAELFISELNQFTAAGQMPEFLFIWLPNDHTFGAAPNSPTPRAAVADNDAGLGMVVDALSHSPFWQNMAIFVSEDDAQDGQDHVSAHRTISLVMSPYVKHGYISHVHHSNVGMLKTMELMLGIGPLSQYDRHATDMRDYFTTTPDLTPYSAVPSSIASERNPSPGHTANAYLREAAEVSKDLNLEDYDSAGAELSRVLWLVHVGEQFEQQRRLAAVGSVALLSLLILGGMLIQRRRAALAA